VHCLGLEFAHPLGLAAGFDKNGDYLDALGALGSATLNWGTRPRRGRSPAIPSRECSRVPATGALVNRMGFNNRGADHLAGQLARSRYPGVRGVSIGKNFDTPIESAEADYVLPA